MADGRGHAAPIEVRVENVSQLFDTLDPFPFRERDLDRDAEEFIVGWVRELPRDQPIRLIIHLPPDKISEQEGEVAGALNRYFGYREGIIERDINELFREGRTALLIGLTVLALCLIAAQFSARQLGDTSFGRFVQESLIILGWVANWKPINVPVRLVAVGPAPESLPSAGAGRCPIESRPVRRRNLLVFVTRMFRTPRRCRPWDARSAAPR